MKKLFLGFAVVAALASCSKNETVDNPNMGKDDLNRISFQSTTGSTVTRATDAGLQTLKDLSNGFEVIGFKEFGKVQQAVYFTQADNAGQVNNWKWGTNAWAWLDGTNPDKNWPKNSDQNIWPMSFIAGVNTDGLTSTSATSPIEYIIADDIENQKDMLAAHSGSLSERPGNGMVPFAFKHMLSSIKFAIKSTQGYKVNVKEVQIVQVTSDGKYDFLNETPTWTAAGAPAAKIPYNYFNSTGITNKHALSFVAGTADMTLPVTGGTVTGSDKGTLMLIPQSGQSMNLANFKAAGDAWVVGGKQDAWPTAAATAALKEGYYIQLTYNMQDATGKDIIGWLAGSGANNTKPLGIDENKNYYVTVVYPLNLQTAGDDKAWEAGKRYTYTISLGTPDASNGTVLDPEYKDDDNGKGPDVDNPKVDPGNPVTSQKIGFTVSVDEWIDQTGSIK